MRLKFNSKALDSRAKNLKNKAPTGRPYWLSQPAIFNQPETRELKTYPPGTKVIAYANAPSVLLSIISRCEDRGEDPVPIWLDGQPRVIDASKLLSKAEYARAKRSMGRAD